MPAIENTGHLLFLGNFANSHRNDRTAVRRTVSDGDCPLIGATILDREQIVENYSLFIKGSGGCLASGRCVNGTVDTMTVNGVQSVVQSYMTLRLSITLPDRRTANATSAAVRLANGNVYLLDSGDTLNRGFRKIEIRAVSVRCTNTATARFPLTKAFFALNDTSIAGFAEGTLIRTDTGEAPVQDLRAGDLVWTADRGFRPIYWTGQTHCTALSQLGDPALRPVCIGRGALGGGLPHRDLVVSRQHRIVLPTGSGDHKEAMVPAIKLIDYPGIQQAEISSPLTYHHICFDRHEVICAQGARSESFHLTPQSLVSLSDQDLERLCAMFPEIHKPNFTPDNARPFLGTAQELRKFLGDDAIAWIKSGLIGRAA